MNQDKIERFALAQFLSDWDDSLTYKQVLESLYDDEDDHTVVWQPFEDFPTYKVAQFIEEMVISMNHWFKEEITND